MAVATHCRRSTCATPPHQPGDTKERSDLHELGSRGFPSRSTSRPPGQRQSPPRDLKRIDFERRLLWLRNPIRRPVV